MDDVTTNFTMGTFHTAANVRATKISNGSEIHQEKRQPSALSFPPTKLRVNLEQNMNR